VSSQPVSGQPVSGQPVSGPRQAVGFLTVLGGSAEPGPAALAWFPVVGAAIGLVVGGAWWVASRAWPGTVAAAIAVAVDLVLTGMLHLDGLCDAADGLLPGLTRERRLEIMRAPDVGAFGVGAAVVVILLRWVALSSVAPAPLLIAGLWAASRTWMAAVVVAVPYARTAGLAAAFRPPRRRRVVNLSSIAGIVFAVGLAAAWRPLVGPAAVAAATVAAAGVVWLAWRLLAGYTGDVLGAAGMIGETVGLLAAAARW
jgi:adenosylcobinamide-GDP ribazoletransferase